MSRTRSHNQSIDLPSDNRKSPWPSLALIVVVLFELLSASVAEAKALQRLYLENMTLSTSAVTAISRVDSALNTHKSLNPGRGYDAFVFHQVAVADSVWLAAEQAIDVTIANIGGAQD